MPLKAKVETLDDVEVAYQDLYEPKDGGFVLKPIEGMKPESEFTVVHGSLTKERADHKATKTKLAAFGDLSPEAAKELKGQVDDLNEALAQTQNDPKAIDKLVDTRVRQQTAPLQRQLTEATAKVGELEGVVTTYKTEKLGATIRDAITTAARGSKVVDGAIDDAVVLGMSMFEVTDNGSVVTKDIAGLTPGLDAASWLADMKAKKSHWWPASAGGGAAGGGGKSDGENPWSKDGWNMTKQGQIIKADKTKAERLAKAAGSAIGATKPPSK